MKILYLAFAGTDQTGVHRKLGEQVRAMRGAGAQVDCVVFADTRVAPAPRDVPYQVLDLPGGGFGMPSRVMAFYNCWESVQQSAPDVVYMRYPIFDAHVLRFLREAPPVVFETQTIFANEIPKESAVIEDRWARRVLPETAGLVAVTSEILAYDLARAGRDVPGLVMPNGADPATIPFTMPSTTPSATPGRIDVLCVASCYPWHGLDRLIVGMAAEPDVTDVHLHLVGDGPTVPALKTLVKEARLGHRVHFHGSLPVAALDPWYAKAHLAVGSLAPHRVGLRELAALKHREYALRGLPMILAGGDADFPATLPWLRCFPADDSPISPRTVRALALAWAPAPRRQQIRKWAESHLAWDVKIPTLLSFLEARCR
jgi:glycosyltransferase involved in cell wall biosynthesis